MATLAPHEAAHVSGSYIVDITNPIGTIAGLPGAPDMSGYSLNSILLGTSSNTLEIRFPGSILPHDLLPFALPSLKGSVTLFDKTFSF